MAVALAAATVGLTATAGASEASVDDLAVSATFDKPAYVTGEDMLITLSVTNNGAATEEIAVSFSDQAPDAIHTHSDDPLGSGAFVTIGAGETRTALVIGSVGDIGITTARLDAWVHDLSGETRTFEFTTLVAPAYGHVSGTVFDDLDGDRVFDDGEGTTGVTVTWHHQSHSETRVSATTGPDGTFAIDRLPTGRYYVSGRGPDGMKLAERFETVTESGVDGLLFRAAPPITGLAAAIEFTKDEFAPAEAPTATVTLTNSGDRPLAGIIANCNRAGSGDQLSGTSTGWGVLAGAGVDLAPGSTTVLDVSEPMPGDAYGRGRVAVYCDFGYRGIENMTDPVGSDRAYVPGKKLDAKGRVTHDGTGVAGVRITIVSEWSATPIAEVTTGADGRYAIPQVQAGRHQAYLTPPAGWQVDGYNPASFTLYAGWWTTFDFQVVPE